jgi:putative MFS transporter
MLFATDTAPLGLVLLGILITLMNSLMGYCSHAYQAELFPTRMRARAVGFVYSWGRLSTAFTSLIIGFLFQRFGTAGVFTFIGHGYVRGAGVCWSFRAAHPWTHTRTNF